MKQLLLQTHHSDFVSLDADIGPSEVAQGGDGGNAGSIHQVPIVVQHVNVHSDLPHLTGNRVFSSRVEEGVVWSFLEWVLPFLQTPHTETRCRCTWSSSDICPAVCSASPTTQTVFKGREKTVHLLHKYSTFFFHRIFFTVSEGFPHLPASNAGEAMGDSSMLKNRIPSFGRFSLGVTSSQDTWAMTLNSSTHPENSHYPTADFSGEDK